MTEQLYRRRAGEPVEVWRVGDGEPPEWAADIASKEALAAWIADPRFHGWWLLEGVSDYPEPPEWVAHYYEPLPAPAPDAREALKRLCEAIRTADAKAVLIEDDAPSYSVPKGLWEVICGAALARIGGGDG